MPKLQVGGVKGKVDAMKKWVNILFILALAVSLMGCKKCIDTVTTTVQVKVTNKHYREEYILMQYYPDTGTISQQYHSATYRIDVEYSGTEYHIYGRNTYEKYADRVGEYANGTLQTMRYDDGTEECKLIGLE